MDGFRDNFRNTTPEESRPDVMLEPEPVRLLERREAGPEHCIMSVMQHAPDAITVKISTTNFGAAFGSSHTLVHIDRATLDLWGDLLFRASEDAARPEVR